MFKFLAELIQSIFGQKNNNKKHRTTNRTARRGYSSSQKNGRSSNSSSNHKAATRKPDIQSVEKTESTTTKEQTAISNDKNPNVMIDDHTASSIDEVSDQHVTETKEDSTLHEEINKSDHQSGNTTSSDTIAENVTDHTNESLDESQNVAGISKNDQDTDVVDDNVNSATPEITSSEKENDEEETDEVEEVFEEDSVVNDEAAPLKINATDVNSEYEIVHFDFDDPASIINYLSNKINSHKLIGYDLLQIESNPDFKKYIHDSAIKYLKINYNRAPNLYVNKELIIISLTLIALDQYDGNYWEHVRKVYSSLYDETRSEQKADAMIRRIIAYYSEGDHRYINFVIRQAIIPKHFLPDFISFCFNIYSDTLKYELMDNMNDVLTNVYLDVSSTYENENNASYAEIKTYGLIKTIKDIINNINWFGELIAYTKVILAYLDAYYWNSTKEINNLPYKTYLEPYIKDWISKHGDIFIKETDHIKSKDTVWKAYFKLSGKSIYLHIPDTIIRNIYDPKTIQIIVFNDSEKIAEIKNPEVKTIFGGYKVSGVSVKLDNPLGKVRYSIVSEDQLIFDSKDNLYREYIAFRDDGIELKTSENYVGNIDIASKNLSGIDGISVYYESPNYKLGNYELSQFETLDFSSNDLTLSSSKVVKVDEEIEPGIIIRTHHHSYPLNKEITQISFSSKDGPDDLKLSVNNKHYHIFKSDSFKKSSIYYYYVPVRNKIENGFNLVEISNRKTSQVIFRKKYFVDRTFKAVFTQINDTIHLKLESCFIKDTEFDADMNQGELFNIPFQSEYYAHTLYMKLRPSISVYKINDGRWHFFNEDVSVKDIDTYGRIWIDGPQFDRVALVSQNASINLPLQINKVKGKYYINTDALMHYVGGKDDRLLLLFYKDNIAANLLNIYYRVVLNENELSVSYDDVKQEASIHFSYSGKDKITLSILDGSNTFYSHDVQSNPADLKIENILPLHAYTIRIECGEDDLFSIDSNKYVIYEQEVSFYSRSELVGRSFSIKKCWGEHFNQLKQEWKEITQPVDNTVVTFLKRDGADEFTGEVRYGKDDVVLTKNVEIELTSEISEGKFWCAIKEEGDFLLYDFDINSIVFDEENTDPKNDLPISEYRMEYFANNSTHEINQEEMEVKENG